MNIIKQEAADFLKNIGFNNEIVENNLRYISTKGGVFSADEEAIGDSLVCVILNYAATKSYYEGVFGDDSSLLCSASSFNSTNMKPHEDSEDVQCEFCSNCEKNKYTTKKDGSYGAKACKDKRKVLISVVGKVDSGKVVYDLVDFQDNLAILNVPTTSIKDFNNYIKAQSAEYKLPTPFCYITKIKIVRVAGYFKLSFENVGAINEVDKLKELNEVRLNNEDCLIKAPRVVSNDQF